MKTLFTFLLVAASAMAQGTVLAGPYSATGPLKTQTGTIASLPGTCTVGQFYFASNATAGQNLYFCTATDTWTQQLASGSCPTCVLASSPGAGVARSAGGTQTVTTSELSGDAITSGSNVVTVTKVAGTAAATIKAKGIPFSLGDEFGSALTVGGAGSTDYITVPYACTISAYNLVIDAADSTFRVKFWKVATGTAKPTSGNSISTSGVGVPSGTAVRSTTLTDFGANTAVSANDIIAMAVFAANTVKMVQGVLQCDQ